MMHLDQIQNKVFAATQVNKIKERLSLVEGSTVFTNGCFDLIHTGHVHYLAKAADLGQFFIIGLNTDASVRKLKGDSRPIKDEINRALVLAAFSFVDMVVLFDDDTPLELIKTCKPDILIKGGDYDPSISDKNNPKYIVGSDFVAKTEEAHKSFNLLRDTPVPSSLIE